MQGHVSLQAVPGELAVAFDIEPLKVGKDPLKRLGNLAGSSSVLEPELDGLLPGPLEKSFPKSGGEFIPRTVQRHRIVLGHPLQQALIVGNHPLAPEPPIRMHCATLQ